MDKDILLNQLQRVPKHKKDILKNQFINKLINTDTGYYHNYVNVRDGYYLWCCFKQQGNIFTFSINGLKSILDGIDTKNVLLFWDYYISQDVMDLGRNELFHCSKQFLVNNLSAFPQDFYVFDETLKWVVVITHEQQNEHGDTGFVIKL
ncbi:hypothetical protein [Paenibacillus elgii]|uniref:hypothetical protein n=1 Tax=Paenibacillus elgii TaxID=189691 RepID=UPI0013D8D20C|nr:hypothetical protein [Paenibacillus elgii]